MSGLYVLARVCGLGLGAALLEAVVGAAPAHLWVLEDAPRARAFSGKRGFEPDGAEKTETVFGDELTEVRLTR